MSNVQQKLDELVEAIKREVVEQIRVGIGVDPIKGSRTMRLPSNHTRLGRRKGEKRTPKDLELLVARGCKAETLCGPDVDEGLELLAKFGWLIASRSDGPAATFCPEHAGRKTGPAFVEKPETVGERVVEELSTEEGRAEFNRGVHEAMQKSRKPLVHYGTITENACNQDHLGVVTLLVDIVTCPRCLEVLAERERGVETIDHPQHYGGADNPYEAIRVIEAWQLGFCLGNTVKYIARAGKKGDELEDLRKAAWYLQREIARLEKSRG